MDAGTAIVAFLPVLRVVKPREDQEDVLAIRRATATSSVEVSVRAPVLRSTSNVVMPETRQAATRPGPNAGAESSSNGSGSCCAGAFNGLPMVCQIPVYAGSPRASLFRALLWKPPALQAFLGSLQELSF